MKKTDLCLFLFLTSFLASASLSLHSQALLQGQPREGIQSKDTTVLAQPIAIGNINSASARTFTMLNRVGVENLRKQETESINARVDSLVNQVSKFVADTIGRDFERMNFRQLEVLNNTIIFFSEQIADEQQNINRRLNEIQNNKNRLVTERKRWNLTSEHLVSNEAPVAIFRRTSNVIRAIDSVNMLVQNDLDFLLTQSDRLTSQQINLDQFTMNIEELERLKTASFFQRDLPLIWNSRHEADSTSASQFWSVFIDNLGDDTNLIQAEYGGRVVITLILFILLLSLMFWLKSTLRQSEISVSKVRLSLYLNEVFMRPVGVSLLLSLYLARLIMPEIPTSYSAIIAILAAYAIVRIALDILPSDLRKFLIGFTIAYIIFRFYNLFYDQGLPGRLMLLSAQAIAVGYFFLYLSKEHRSRKMRRSFFIVFLNGLSGVYLLFMLLAIAGNILGALSLSEYLSGGIIRSTFFIMSAYVGFHVLASLVYLIMSGPAVQKLNMIRSQFGYIYGRAFGILRLVFILSWVLVALGQFNVRQDFLDWGSEFLNQPINIGKASFTLMSIFLFVFVIWLSLFISRIIRHVLQEEVFPRIKTKRGIPGTIIMLLRVSLVTIGFFLAAAAAGIRLDSLTIILGAFSVGIGFGLQNIFNNLVSGLILAFERPIKAGDIVEVNNLLGKVKQIGIRSSIVRTFEGAEVVVPNGELISNEMINWTLSDQNRRADIRVGVKYGTDPELVRSLLLEVASENPRVLKDPEPRSYFIEFGDSSLNFRLLAWIDQDHRLEVESELLVGIDTKLKEADIEIPFPQRDLHVRSVDPKIIRDLEK